MKVYFTTFRYIGFSLFFVCSAIWLILKERPDWVELYHSRFFYILVTEPVAYLAALIDFPLVEPFFLLCFLLLFAVPIYCFVRYRRFGLIAVGIHVVVLGLAIAFWFTFFAMPFFFNTLRFPAERIFDVETPLNSAQIAEAKDSLIASANRLAIKMNKGEDSCTDFNLDLSQLDELVLSNQNKSLSTMGIKGINNAKGQYYIYGDFWRALGPSGLVFPQAGAQPIISSTLHPIQQPWTLAHERGHLNGFTAEDAASLMAYKTAFDSGDDRLIYPSLFRLIGRNESTDKMNAALISDRLCVKNNWDKIERTWMTKLYFKGYGKFLNATGHEKGISTYEYGEELGLRYYYKFVLRKDI